jgi:methionine aminopeptidase
MITIYRGTDLDGLRRAGGVAAATLHVVCAAVRPGMSTGDINRLVATSAATASADVCTKTHTYPTSGAAAAASALR